MLNHSEKVELPSTPPNSLPQLKAAEAVKAGAEFLDSKALIHPQLQGWRQKLDLQRLDIGNMDNCVLGQLFGCFMTGAGMLDLRDFDRFDLGFDQEYASYEMLTAAWKAELSR